MSIRVLIAAFCLAVSVSAQNTIDLNVIVHRKAGPPIGGSTQNDFTVLDNRVPQTIASFRALDSAQPAHMISVVDAVNASFTNVAYQRGQLHEFLRAHRGAL